MTLQSITHKALRLSRMERIELARLMLDSIMEEENDSPTDVSVSYAQITEIKRRIESYRNGEIQAIPAVEVHQKLAKKYGL
ncbi:MAG: addiction module protein [Chitinophagales bacterium]